ncbi:MAG: hypothetical protein WBL37_04975 [Dehalococcoidales bacterium]
MSKEVTLFREKGCRINQWASIICGVLVDYLYYITDCEIPSMNIDRLSRFVDNYNTASTTKNFTPV